MRTHRCVLAILCGVSVGLQTASAQVPATLPKVAGPSRFDYHDDHDNRRLADIRLNLVERDGQRSLELVIAAVGPQVEPIPGWQGVHGANRHTAEQIENILTGRFAFLVKSQKDDGSVPWLGRWREGKRGKIPERRLGADGRIDLSALTPRAYPLELVVETLGVHDGKQTTELWFDGVPRLRVSYVVAGNEARIVGLASLGRTPSSQSAEFVVQDRQEPKEEPFEFPVSEAAWKARDLESKWLVYRSTVADNVRKARPFAAELAKRKEYDLLEMIALHQPLFDGGIDAAWALARADAPQWLRVAAWLRLTEINHGEGETEQMILKHNPGKALAWLTRHADLAILSPWEKENPRKVGEYNVLRGELLVLKRRKTIPTDLGDALSPLDPIDVFRHLDAPAELAVFGDRARAEPGVVYLHQVLRAIKGLELSGKYRQPWIGKLRRLTTHPHPEVRQAALLTFSQFVGSLDPADSPVDEFRRMMDDPKETPAIREAALMAFTYCNHPQVYVRLHEVLDEFDHPAWAAAVGQLHDDFALAHFDRLAGAKVPASRAKLFEARRQALRQWSEDPQRNRGLTTQVVHRLLERAAWAEHVKSPVAKTLTPWTKAQFARIDENVESSLVNLYSSYAPSFRGTDAPAVARQVRRLAEEILLTAKIEKKAQ